LTSLFSKVSAVAGPGTPGLKLAQNHHLTRGDTNVKSWENRR